MNAKQVVRILFLVCLVSASSAARADELTPVDPDASLVRRPIALAGWESSELVAIGNRCGTVSLLSANQLTRQSEYRLGSQLADLEALSKPGHALALLQGDSDKLVWIELTSQYGRSLVELALNASGYDLEVAPDQERVAITFRWQRSVAIINCRDDDSTPTLENSQSVALPFEPGPLLWIDDHRFVVADAFGNRVALIDLRRSEQILEHVVDGHNLAGLAQLPGNSSVFVTHQKLDERSPITEVAIEFGDIMKHRVGVLSLNDFAEPTGSHGNAHGKSIELGFTGLAATDPMGMLAVDSKTLAIVLHGVDELTLLDVATSTESRIRVGDGPTDILKLPNSELMLVSNQYSDTLSVVDPKRQLVTSTVSLGTRGELSAAERGEQIFFDADRTRDRWMSCHSCHSLGHTNGRLADTMSDGAHGNPKRVLSLLGVSQSGPWGWNGTKTSLRQQVTQTIRETMHGPPLSAKEVDDVVAFLKTLKRPTELLRQAKDSELIAAGAAVFKAQGCVDCHDPNRSFTSDGAYDVGLADELGFTEFNPPSLHGLAYRRFFFHDKRSTRLTEVFEGVQHPQPLELDQSEMDALLAYLRSL